jgi:DNA-binding transcriptional ArsR family regulator
MAKSVTPKRKKSDAPDDLLDERIVKAISHPLRHRLLVLLNDRVASPNQLATQLEEPLGRVSYHVRQLAEVGAIELVRTRPRRGAVEHFYRAVSRAWFSDADWALLPDTTRRTIFGQNLARIGRDVTAAAAHGGFDDVRAHVSFTLFDLDAEAMAAMSELLSQTLQQALAINAESAQRREASDGGDIRTMELALLHFGRAPDG